MYAIPVILLGFVQTPIQFLICRLFMGFIGTSFVITQFHISMAFVSNIVGTANAPPSAASSGYFIVSILVVVTATVPLLIKFSTEYEVAVASEMKIELT